MVNTRAAGAPKKAKLRARCRSPAAWSPRGTPASEYSAQPTARRRCRYGSRHLTG